MQLAVFMGLLLFLMPQLQAQQPCPKYDKAMEEADALMAAGDKFAEALLRYQVAQIAARECNISGDKAAIGLDNALKGLQKQKEDAVKAKEDAIKAQKRATKSAIEAKAFRENFNFLYDKWALISLQQEQKYVYINKSGKKTSNYDNLEAFENTTSPFPCLAIGRQGDKTFFVDTLGSYNNDSSIVNEYLVATSISGLNDSITALDLRDAGLTELPAELWEHDQLKILLLGGNKLSALPEEIGKLKNLSYLQLGHCQFNALPVALADMPVLRYLDVPQHLKSQAISILAKRKTKDASYKTEHRTDE